MTACCVIIRCDTLVLFAPFLLLMLWDHVLPLPQILITGLLSGLASLGLSVCLWGCVDVSFLWTASSGNTRWFLSFPFSTSTQC